MEAPSVLENPDLLVQKWWDQMGRRSATKSYSHTEATPKLPISRNDVLVGLQLHTSLRAFSRIYIFVCSH